jgi:hypothetical protein
VLGLTLPDWIDPDSARTIALVVGSSAVVLAIVVLRFVQKLVMKVAFTAVLALIALFAWTQRADLSDCARTCECRLLGFDVEIPRDQRVQSCEPST